MSKYSTYRAVAKYAPRVAAGAYKRATIYGPAVKQLASDVMYLKGLINSEPKNHVENFNNNINWAGTVLSCCDVVQGDGSQNRDGARILPRYFGLHMTINRTATATAAHQQCRVIVFKWWGEVPTATGTAPSVSDIIDGAGTQDAPRSFLSTAITGPRGDRVRRIEVLRNYYKTLSADDSQLDIVDNIEMNGKSKQRKEHMEFYGATTAPPTSGGIFILIITDNVLSEVAYHVSSKLTFYDN